MEKDEARKLLSFHSGRNNDIHNPQMGEMDFLGCLMTVFAVNFARKILLR